MGVLFDQPAFVKRLEDPGVTRPHAEAISESVHEAVLETVATKQDVALLRQDMDVLRRDVMQDIDVLRRDITQGLDVLRRDSRQDLDALQRDLKQDMDVRSADNKKETDALRRDLDTTRSSLQADIAQVRVAIAESKVWTVSVGATIVAVLAAMKYVG